MACGGPASPGGGQGGGDHDSSRPQVSTIHRFAGDFPMQRLARHPSAGISPANMLRKARSRARLDSESQGGLGRKAQPTDPTIMAMPLIRATPDSDAAVGGGACPTCRP